MTAGDPAGRVGAADVGEETYPDDRRALVGLLLTGEQVLHSARMVGDGQDATVWREAWVDSTALALSGLLPEEAVERFRRASRADAGDTWRTTFESEVRPVEAGLDLLSSLLGTRQ